MINTNSIKNIGVLWLIIIAAASVIFTSCTSVKKAGAKSYDLTITNPSTIERAEELVVLTRETIEQKTGKLATGDFINIVAPGNDTILIQFDDINKDRSWDEAAFLYTFQPRETVHLKLSKTRSIIDTSASRAHVRLRKKNADNTFGPLLDSLTIPGNTPNTDFSKQKLPLYLTEGPAWENDKVAFRIYMDTRNTKDIFGKLTPKMMMDTVGVNPENSYHNISDWGMDILAVGKSLGAGSLALSIPETGGKDSLVRLGGANIETITYEKIADGPVRAILRMHYKNWKVSNNSEPVNVTEEISIWAGKYYYESKVTVNNAPQGAALVTGIVNLKSKRSHQIDTANCKVLYTYDLQGENKDNLGMAVAVRSNNFISFGTTPNASSDVLNTYTVTLPITETPSQFRFYSGWERSDLLFTREESFKKFLEFEAVKYGTPLVIGWL